MLACAPLCMLHLHETDDSHSDIWEADQPRTLETSRLLFMDDYPGFSLASPRSPPPHIEITDSDFWSFLI